MKPHKIYSGNLASEGITPGTLAMVDLDIAFSPVLPFPGGRMGDEVEAVKCEKGYFVKHALGGHMAGGGELKVMRCRYLIAREHAHKT